MQCTMQEGVIWVGKHCSERAYVRDDTCVAICSINRASQGYKVKKYISSGKNNRRKNLLVPVPSCLVYSHACSICSINIYSLVNLKFTAHYYSDLLPIILYTQYYPQIGMRKICLG